MATDGMRRLERLRIRKIRDRVQEIGHRFLYAERHGVADVAVAETSEHLSLPEAKRLSYRPARDGMRWGKDWGTGWFRLRIRVPKSLGGERVFLLFDLGNSECLIYRDGAPVQGLCWSRKEYLLLKKAQGGERIELFVEAGANARLGAFEPRTFRRPEIAALHREVWEAYWDLSALYDIIDPVVHHDWTGKPYHLLSEHDTRRARIIHALDEAVDEFDYGDPSTEDLRRQARKVRRTLEPIYDCGASASAQVFAAMGHAHIDIAWKWPLAETVRKCGRTFSNVLELMEQYPEFLFAQSQPYLYECAKSRYPTLYGGIKRRVKQGRWIPTGCMWVEPDCNVPSGESLVRQVLFGTRFYKREFDYDAATLWVPDVFGFSGALPQILARSGIRYFFTTKIALNQFAKFPYHSFHWEGIDGSEVLAHFMPAEEYSSEVEPWLIRTGEYDYAEKDRSSIQILPFGHGDGGGGPARPHLERLKRYEDFEGLPRVVSMSPKEFFERLEGESDTFPRWVGELYLEMHRGCYTTQAHTKKYNRLAEFALRDAEMLCALHSAAGARYPQRQLNAAWKLVLLNQFHDILPGSSIDEVYVESDRQYAEVFETTAGVTATALEKLARQVDTRGEGAAVLAFNSLGWERDGVVEAEVRGLRRGASYVTGSPGEPDVPVQVGVDGKARFSGTLPSIGHKVFHIRRGKADAPHVRTTDRVMENTVLRVEFDKQGRLVRIHDKRFDRDVLAPGQIGNQFILFEDKMASTGAAWDVDFFYEDKPLEFDGRPISRTPVESGPVRGVMGTKRAIGKSTIEQNMILYAGSARIDFATTVEWGDEKDVLLKVAFPVNVHADKARYEIQYGSLERPTHRNMPQDVARFEVPAQKWADLSEGNYGVALLNDCKYGYDVHRNTMRLTLLRAARDPGKRADVCRTHTFTYALFPHPRDFTGGVVREGYALNVPPIARCVTASPGKLPAQASRFEISGENVAIDAMKKAEDDDGMILRLYESHGWRTRNVLKTTLPVARVVETDLMEREERAVTCRRGEVGLDFRPFEIRTLKFVLKK